MKPPVTFNPYLPPESPVESDVQLSPDTEFLASEKCVLCGDAVSLPAICIVSGEKSGLIEQSGVLQWHSAWLNWIFPGWGILVVPGLAGNFLGRPYVKVLVLVYLALILCGVWLRRFRTRRVNACWYLSRVELQQCQKRQRTLRMIAAAAFVISSGLIPVALYVSDQVYPFIPTALVISLCSWLLIPKVPQPQFVGVHQGLNILMGLSPLFLQKVQDLIEHQSLAGQSDEQRD